MKRSFPACGAIVAIAALCAHGKAEAFSVSIGPPGHRAIYLQVGNGSYTGTYAGGGTPGTNATVNQVTVSVPASAMGSGAAQQMTSDSIQSVSYYNGRAFCNPPVQVYIGGFFRFPGPGIATLSVTTSAANLVNATGDTIPFSQISWTSAGTGDVGVEVIPGGSFTGGTQTLASFATDSWNESCHTFSYANTASVASGTYTGRATYTLSSP